MMRRQAVERRAEYRCEYCHTQKVVAGYTFHLEHIHPKAEGGTSTNANAALSCWSCNTAKSDYLTGTDPRTGRQAPLFNPRRQRWDEHFRLSADFCRILGRTATGRATVARLRMNDPRFQPQARKFWMAAGCWP